MESELLGIFIRGQALRHFAKTRFKLAESEDFFDDHQIAALV
jgi:hypothetical protein